MDNEEPRDNRPPNTPLCEYDKADLVGVLDRTSQRLSTLEEKYWQLVWYARKDGSEPGAQEGIEKVESQYPGEVDAVNDEDGGDWAHGFHSGVLATVRLLRAYVEGLEECENQDRWHQALYDELGKDEYEEEYGPLAPYEPDWVIAEAEDEFPWLDT